MNSNTKKRKRVAHFGKKQSFQKESPLDEDNMSTIMKNMDYLRTSEQNFLSYQKHASNSTLNTKDPRQNADSIPRTQQKHFNSGKIHPLMKKCQRNFKNLEKNRCIPKPRAHVGHIPRPPRNPEFHKELQADTKSDTFNSTQGESSLKLIEAPSSSKKRTANIKSNVVLDEEPKYYQSSSGSSDDDFEKFLSRNRKSRARSESNSSYSSDSDVQSKKKKSKRITNVKSRKTVPRIRKKITNVTKKMLSDSSDDETEIANANNLKSKSVSLKNAETAINDSEHLKCNILSDGSFVDSPFNTIDHSNSSDSFDSAEYHNALQSSNISDNESISNADDNTYNQTFKKKKICNIRRSSDDNLSVGKLVKTSNKESVQVEDDCRVISDTLNISNTSSAKKESTDITTNASSAQLTGNESLNSNSLPLGDNSIIKSPDDCFTPKIVAIESISRNVFLENAEKSNKTNKDSSITSSSTLDEKEDSDIEILQVNNYSDTRLIPSLPSSKRQTMPKNIDSLENLKDDILNTLSKIDFERIKQVINPSANNLKTHEQSENINNKNDLTLKNRSENCNEILVQSNQSSEMSHANEKCSSNTSNVVSNDNVKVVEEESPDIIVCAVINRSKDKHLRCSSHKGNKYLLGNIKSNSETNLISQNSKKDIEEIPNIARENSFNDINQLTEYLKEELDDSQKSVLPLLDLYKLEYEKYLSIVNTEHNVSAGLKLYEEQQHMKLVHLRSSIQKFMNIDFCYKKILDKTDLQERDCKQMENVSIDEKSLHSKKVSSSAEKISNFRNNSSVEESLHRKKTIFKSEMKYNASELQSGKYNTSGTLHKPENSSEQRSVSSKPER